MRRSLPLAAAVWSSMMAGQGYGQTAIDLRTQSKSVDFSGALYTKPVRTGTSLPATCQLGELFFRTDIATGKNLYGCVATNSWQQMAADVSFSGVTGTAAIAQGGTGAGNAGTARANLGAAAAVHTHNLTDLNGVTGKTGGGSLVQMSGGGTINSNDCARFDANGNVVSAGGPCGSGGTGSPPVLTSVAFSATPTFLVTNTTQGFTLTLTGAVTSSMFSGAPSDGQEVWFRICQDGTAGHAFAYPASVTGADAIDTAVNACTSQLFKYIGASTSYAAITAGKSDNATPGLTTGAGTLNLPAPSGNATLTQTIASGTSALGTSAIASQACAPMVTTTASGTAATDVIIVTPNASIKAVTGFTAAAAGGLAVSWYPTANAVNFDVCNWSSGTISPGVVTLNWRVVR